ncbi:hypothetical protein JRQ81_013274 [Phrynocephalus forsythii]|uniref:Uncharacterized protein n=1 Tax=Phrynocephalus forsythii TaxID=171643 RepID=A0A9Q0XZJ3_9SAUR|nr:hypothetical protein JRQ81_013274 [Phrynocephalus forsythii]
MLDFASFALECNRVQAHRQKICLSRAHVHSRSSKSPEDRHHHARCTYYVYHSDSLSSTSNRRSTPQLSPTRSAHRSRSDHQRDAGANGRERGRSPTCHRRSASPSKDCKRRRSYIQVISCSSGDDGSPHHRQSPARRLRSTSPPPKRAKKDAREAAYASQAHSSTVGSGHTSTAISGRSQSRSLSPTSRHDSTQQPRSPCHERHLRSSTLASMDRSLLLDVYEDSQSAQSSHSPLRHLRAADSEEAEDTGPPPEEDYAAYSRLIHKVAKVMDLQVQQPDAEESCKYLGHLSKNKTPPLHLGFIPSLLKHAKSCLSKPASTPLMLRRTDNLYRTHREETTFLAQHPLPNSLIVNASQNRSKNTATSVPSNKEGRKARPYWEETVFSGIFCAVHIEPPMCHGHLY